MTRRCEIIQWLSIFFGFAIHHNLQYYQYPQYWYDTNTDTIPIPIYIPIPLLLSVCEIVQRFTLALPFVTFQYRPSWSCQIHEDIWKIFGPRSVIECFQPFGPPCHQLMYTYYQFVPPRCKWLYNDTAPHTANHTGNIRSTIRTIRTTYGQPYEPYGPHTASHTNGAGQHTAAWKSMRYCRRQDRGLSQIKYHYHSLPYRNLYKVWSNNRKCRQHSFSSGDITDWVQMSHCQVFQQIAWFVKRWHELYSLSEPPAHKVIITIKPQWKS